MTLHSYPDESEAAKEAEEYYVTFGERAAAAPPLPTEAVALRNLWPSVIAADRGGQPYLSEHAKEIELDTPGGPLRARVMEAEEPTGLYLHIHGGGWTVGAPDQEDLRNEFLHQELGLTVVSLDYRLAPEDPYPAGLDDCEAAARWLLDDGGERFGSDRVLIGGESAGANLSLATALRLVKNPAPGGAVAGLNLLYGNYDLLMTPSQQAGSTVLPAPFLHWFYDQYLPLEQRRIPEASPLYDDLRGLPPVLLTVGSADAMVDDSMFLYGRLLLAGVPCELSLVPGADHGFDAVDLKAAKLARETIVNFLRDLPK